MEEVDENKALPILGWSRLALAIVALQGLGALLTSLFFNLIVPLDDGRTLLEVLKPFIAAPIIASIGGVFQYNRDKLISKFRLMVLNGEEIPAELRQKVLRRILNSPLTTSLGVFVVWMSVAFFLAIQHLESLVWIQVLFGVGVVPGGICAVLSYFVAEAVWRPWLEHLFPALRAEEMKGTFFLTVRARLLLMLAFGAVLPLLMLSMLTISKVTALR